MKTWWELYERNKLKIEKCFEVGMEDKVENRQRVKKEIWEQHMKDPIAAVHQALRKVEADASICQCLRRQRGSTSFDLFLSVVACT